MSEMIERVAEAIDTVQLFSRFNGWASDRVEGLPVEICRYGGQGEDEIVVIKRFPASEGESDALYEVVSEYRARAAIEAMREPICAAIHCGCAHYCDFDEAEDKIRAALDDALKG